jgi:hypothetical protein
MTPATAFAAEFEQEFEQRGRRPASLRARRLLEAKRSYAALLAKGARLFIGASAGHSNRDVLVLLPPLFNPGEPFEVRLHYHGMFSTASRPAAEATLPARIAAHWRRGPVVFVFPFATLDGRSYPDWSPARDTHKTVADALKLAGIDGGQSRLIVSGHSAGGSALSYLILHRGLGCDLLILEDCLYNSVKGDVIGWGKATSCRQVISFHGTNSRWICPPDLPRQTLVHVCASRPGGHYEHVLLDPHATFPPCGCPAARKPRSPAPRKESELEFETPPVQRSLEAAALVGLIPFIQGNLKVDPDNARAICQFIGIHLSMPWQLLFLVLEHEGGLRNLKHKDGVMQTIDASRHDGVKALPVALKQAIVLDSTLTGAALDRALLGTFANKTLTSRRLCAQIAVGAAELRAYLNRYQGFVAPALAAYNTGSGPKAWVARQDRALSRVERCRRVARIYQQPPSAISVAGGKWLCDPNIPAWAWRASISDKASGHPIRGYQYLRGVASLCAKRPSEPCLRRSPKHQHVACPVEVTATKVTRRGSLEKLFDPRLMQPLYRNAVAGRWPSLSDDGTPLRAVGLKVVAEP